MITAQLPEQTAMPPWQPGSSNLQEIIAQHEATIASLQDLWTCLEDLDKQVAL